MWLWPRLLYYCPVICWGECECECRGNWTGILIPTALYTALTCSNKCTSHLLDSVRTAQPSGGDTHNSTLEQYAKVHRADRYFCTTAAMCSEHTTCAGTQPVAMQNINVKVHLYCANNSSNHIKPCYSVSFRHKISLTPRTRNVPELKQWQNSRAFMGPEGYAMFSLRYPDMCCWWSKGSAEPWTYFPPKWNPHRIVCRNQATFHCKLFLYLPFSFVTMNAKIRSVFQWVSKSHTLIYCIWGFTVITPKSFVLWDIYYYSQ
jgi:hypothetical protein